MLRKRIGKFILFSFLFVLVLGITSVLANSYDATMFAHPDDPISVEMQAIEAAAIEKNEQLFRSWAGGAAYFDAFSVDFPHFFGGTYIGYGHRLVIQVTTLDDEIRDYFSNIIDTASVVFKEVNHSLRDLMDFQDAVISLRDFDSENRLFASISSVGLVIDDNAVVVSLVNPEIAAASNGSLGARGVNLADEFISNATEIIFDAAIIEGENSRGLSASGEPITPEIIMVDVREGFVGRATAATAPGSGLMPNGASVGFWAHRGGQIGFVSTGHAWSVGTNVSPVGPFATFGNVAWNRFQGDMDASFVVRTNSTFRGTNRVPGWGFALSTTPVNPTMLSMVWARGTTTGTMTGMVSAVNVTLTCGCCRTTSTGLTRVSMNSVGGDSGGIVASGGSVASRHITGIITAGIRNTTYIVPAPRIVIQAGLNMSLAVEGM